MYSARRRLRPESLKHARDMRSVAPFPERLPWSRLRAGRLGRLGWRRQHLIGPYIVDFYCPAVNLAVELDGRSHVGRAVHDGERAKYIVAQGVRLIRFTNDQVLSDLDGVAKAIATTIGVEG